MNLFLMHWAELGLSRQAVTVLILKEHIVQIRWPIYLRWGRLQQISQSTLKWWGRSIYGHGAEVGDVGCLERREPWSTGETILTTAPAPSVLSSDSSLKTLSEPNKQKDTINLLKTGYYNNSQESVWSGACRRKRKQNKPALRGPQLQSFLEPLEHDAQKNKMSLVMSGNRTKNISYFQEILHLYQSTNLRW